MGTEEEIREHEEKCPDNYDRKSCETCTHKKFDMKARWYTCDAGKETDMYKKCKEGLHPLKEISRTSDGFTDKVVRWCPDCGAIVIDMECDGRVYAGRYQKMVLPKICR